MSSLHSAYLLCFIYHYNYCYQLSHIIPQIITGPPNGPVLFCSLASVVVCNAAGGRVNRPPGAWAVGLPTLHSGPVRLRPVRATPCYTNVSGLL